MDEQPENTSVIENTEAYSTDRDHNWNRAVLILPLVLSIFLFIGFTYVDSAKTLVNETEATNKHNKKKIPDINLAALLAAEEFSKNLRDTVYTNDDLWLEFRIDHQMLYVHYKDGRIIKYPVSSGNPHASKSVESRPGLYAIFLKEEVHLSSQFDDARMNYFMPYNMGIGFHGLQGTGYYGHLGVRTSSHGCIRMRNEDVKVLFSQCKIGTLVLSHKGKSTRVVAFAPEGFKNDAEYNKDDYMNILAYNLSSLMEGKYFINSPKRFIMDGTVIPRSGINVRSTEEIPEKQILPFAVLLFPMLPDNLRHKPISSEDVKNINETELADNFEFVALDSTSISSIELAVNPEIVKKYAHNPIGILPYFPPNR